jgi:DNA-binding NarL/FixJ family response regulator
VTPHAHGAAAAEIDEAGARRQVLLVDRQPLFLEALRSLLDTAPLRAETLIATRSDDAVATALGGSVDLVVCDMLAQPLDGTAVVRALGQRSPRVPVILLGDLTEVSSATSLLLDGAAGLFTKDVAPADLVAGVEAVLAGHQAMGSNLLSMVLSSGAVSVPSQVAGAVSRLSPAEREVLAMVGRGRSVPEIGAARQISHKTVRNHMASIYRKLELKNRVEAMLFATRMGLVGDRPDSAHAGWADVPSAPGADVLNGGAIPIASHDDHCDDP